MLLKVFAVDVLACPNCQSRMQRIAWTIRPQRSAGRIGPHRRSRWRPRRGEGQGPESNATASHSGDPRLRRSQTPTAIDSLKDSENSECESPAIIAVRGSSVFPLTQAGAERINKQEPTPANTLEREIIPRQSTSLSSFNPVPAPNSGTPRSGPTK